MSAPALKHNGFVFVKIRGGFHDIRSAICDIVAISRLLNAALVIPELQPTTSSKGISSGFKSFNYLYDEDHFIAALAKDVMVVKTLPKQLKVAKRNNDVPVFTVRFSTSPDFYLKSVLPMLKRHSIVEILVPDGGCLQALLPPTFEEYQRLRCRVAFHALRFRGEVQELATKIVRRLRSSGRPFIAFDPGLTKDALAYHGCAEQFQDVHTELIQHKRKWMIKHGIIKGNLAADSVQLHLNGTCPLMPEEIGIVLRAFGYPQDTIIYVAEGELFGGQRLMIPLHSMFDNVVDRTSLATVKELTAIYGHEDFSDSSSHPLPPVVSEQMRIAAWKISGPRPRPLPPPPSRLKYQYNAEGWWGWVAQSDREPQPTITELRAHAHKLLWDAIDYIVSIEADAFIPGFDRDGLGHPNFASLVMGHRLYLNAAAKTFRPDRKTIALLLEEVRKHLYQANRTWVASVRKHLTESVIKGLTDAAANSKPFSFLSHPVPECLCMRRSSHLSQISSSNRTNSRDDNTMGVNYKCPEGMSGSKVSYLESYEEEDLEESDDISSKFFQQDRGSSHGVEINMKDVQLEDQDENEGGER
ncbi:unnamed protein product [Victoria cruziana]